jgi:hypothetical protein
MSARTVIAEGFNYRRKVLGSFDPARFRNLTAKGTKETRRLESVDHEGKPTSPPSWTFVPFVVSKIQNAHFADKFFKMPDNELAARV